MTTFSLYKCKNRDLYIVPSRMESIKYCLGSMVKVGKIDEVTLSLNEKRFAKLEESLDPQTLCRLLDKNPKELQKELEIRPFSYGEDAVPGMSDIEYQAFSVATKNIKAKEERHLKELGRKYPQTFGQKMPERLDEHTALIRWTSPDPRDLANGLDIFRESYNNECEIFIPLHELNQIISLCGRWKGHPLEMNGSGFDSIIELAAIFVNDM
jgi:hypothetical protein